MSNMSDSVAVAVAKNLNDLIGPVFNELKDSIETFTEKISKSQVEGVERIVDSFVDRMNQSLGNQFDNLKNTIEATCDWQKKTLDSMDIVVSGIKTEADYINDMNQKLQTTIKYFDEYMDKLIAQENALSTQLEAFENGLGLIINTLENELEKYYCPKTVTFFKRIADSEINFQLREKAVQHLLSLGHYAKLRKQKYMRSHAGNKKRRDRLLHEYSKERYSIETIPQELEYRIKNSKEQQIKSYDYFISHSSIDYEVVQTLIDKLNEAGMNVYCDWISDSDYLKRRLLCDATLDIIEKRIAQSKKVLLLDSKNSRCSNWVKYELNYAKELGKPLLVISIDVAYNGISQIKELQDNWFNDSQYKKIKLIPVRMEE